MVHVVADLDGITTTTEGDKILLLAIPESEITESLLKLEGKKVVVDLKKYQEGRSYNANAYFHVLCNELRKKLNISFAKCKNILITSYGQIETLEEGTPIIYKTNAPPEVIEEQETVHMKLVKVTNDAYFYKVYRGSHTYDKSEMAILINGTVADCKEQGIETMTPQELAKMINDWEKHYGKLEKDN